MEEGREVIVVIVWCGCTDPNAELVTDQGKHDTQLATHPTKLRAMTTISNLGSTGIYAYTTLISVFICVPGIFFFEPGVWAAIREQVAQRGAANFYGALLSVGLLYHLYNQFAFNTLSRITPVSHGVCNVVKRVVIIATSGAHPAVSSVDGACVLFPRAWLA